MSKIIKNGVTYGGMPTVSGNISYDNTSSGLNAITVQNAITELKEIYDLPKGYAWAGTQDEWDALSAQEKQIYDDKVVLITDDVENSFQRTLLYDSGSYDTGAAFQTDINLLDNLSHYDIVGILCGNDTDNVRDDTCYGDMRFFDVGYLLEENANNTPVLYYSGYATRWMSVKFTDTTFNIVNGEGSSGSSSSTNRPTIYKIYGYKFKGTVGPGGGSGDLTAADVAFSDTTRSASIYTNVTNVEEALMAVKGAVSNFDATDISFTAPSASGHSTYGANTNTVQEALNDINDAMRSVIQYGTIKDNNGQYYIDARDTYYNPCGGIFGNIHAYTVYKALDWLNDMTSENIPLPSASKTGIYANADDVQDALDAIKTALDSGGGGGSVDASDVSFDDASGCWGGACAGNVDQALRDLDERVVALSEGGGGGPVDASDVTFDYTKSSCWGGSSGDSVEDALFDLDERVRGLSGVIDTTDVAIPSASRTGIYATAATAQAALDVVKTELSSLDSTDITIPAASKTGIYANTATVQQALDAIKTAISSGGGGGSSSASSVSFTKPQGGIYSSGTDTVQEALEDVNYKIIYLEASDIGFLGSGCGGGYPTDVETVQDALDALEHLLYKYSEFEKETGLLWFNDKPIYQISVKPESGTTNLFDTNELEIDDLVYMEATLTDSSGTKRWTISGSSGDFYWNTATHMIVYGGSDVITTATIRYTKTSD